MENGGLMSQMRKFTILLACLLIGCSPTQATYLPEAQVPPSESVSEPTQQAIPVELLSPTVLNTPTPGIYPTMTFVPTLPVAEAETKLIEILSNNGNCRLPCFWGLTPGKTKVETYASSLYIYHALFDPTGGWADIDITRGNLILDTSVTLGGEQDAEIIRRLSVTMAAYDGQKDQSKSVYNSPVYAQYFRYYTLPYLLSAYGKPENVYIHYENEMYPHEYYLVLDYTKSGWVASFTMALGMKTQSGDILIGCPAEAFTTLILWSPDDIETAQKYGYAYGPGMLTPIEKATSLTLDEFYQLRTYAKLRD
jgi:hypothetical protein